MSPWSLILSLREHNRRTGPPTGYGQNGRKMQKCHLCPARIPRQGFCPKRIPSTNVFSQVISPGGLQRARNCAGGGSVGEGRSGSDGVGCTDFAEGRSRPSGRRPSRGSGPARLLPSAEGPLPAAAVCSTVAWPGTCRVRCAACGVVRRSHYSLHDGDVERSQGPQAGRDAAGVSADSGSWWRGRRRRIAAAGTAAAGGTERRGDRSKPGTTAPAAHEPAA
jgi:hypothetical protein